MKRKSVLVLAMLMLLTSVAASCGKKETTKKKKIVKKTTATAEDTSEVPDATNDTTKKDPNAGEFQPDFTFQITDRDGNTITQEDLASNKLTMINFWEPWCGPCVSEMPDLEKLYEDYKDQGFVIIGVYSEPDMEEDVNVILKDAGITYPICSYVNAFDPFQTGYVPTTIFIDQNGHVITLDDGQQVSIGSRDYASWQAIVTKYL